MLVYCIVLLLICAAAALPKKDQKQMFPLALVLLTAVSGLRGEGIGADYYGYKSLYATIGKASGSGIFRNWSEPGYALLNKAVSILSGGSYQWFLAVCALLAMLGVVYFIKEYSRYPIISFWLFITMGMYTNTFTRLRQAIAISIVLIAYKYLAEKNMSSSFCWFCWR